MILPGQAFGVLGGGPLARMLTHAARTLGYRVAVFEPDAFRAAQAAPDRALVANYDDLPALGAFARECAVVTGVFENVPRTSLETIAAQTALRPGVDAFHLTQHRQREKAWLRVNGFPHVRYAEALDGDIVSVIGQVGRPCVVKTAEFSADGQGQMKIVTDDELDRATTIVDGRPCLLERWVDISCELSVALARSTTGEVVFFPLTETIHTRNILDLAITPARVGAAVQREAEQLAATIAEKLGVVGLLAVEMFVAANGQVLVNELVARPHNSAHWTLDGCATSQFEQHVRAVCGLPLGAVELREPIVMVNLLGEARPRSEDRELTAPAWSAILAEPRAKLHIYKGAEPRSGQKIGHFTLRAPDLETAIEQAKELNAKLRVG